MRIVGWKAAGGGGTTHVPVLEGEMISSGMGALLFLQCAEELTLGLTAEGEQ